MSKKDDKPFIFFWKLNFLRPRVNVVIAQDANIEYLNEQFPFRYRMIDSNATFRHYRVPIYFHFPFVRKHFENKLNK